MFKHSSSKLIGGGEACLNPLLTSNSIIWTHTLKITFTSNKASEIEKSINAIYIGTKEILRQVDPEAFYVSQFPPNLNNFIDQSMPTTLFIWVPLLFQ